MISIKKLKDKTVTKNKLPLMNIVLSVLIFAIIIITILNPAKYASSALNGLIVFGTKILPCLFPFFFLTKILMDLKAINALGTFFSPVTKKLYNAPGISAYVFLTGLICGYPVSAKITTDLFLSSTITKDDAYKIASFTSTSGPMFVLGTVGSGMLKNTGVGFAILLCHVLGALMTGFVFSKKHKKTKKVSITNIENEKIDYASSMSKSLDNAISSIFVVGGYIVVFFMLIDIVLSIVPVTGLSRTFLAGFIEMTRGCLELSNLQLTAWQNIVYGTAIISFGGLSVMFQAFAFLQKCRMKLSQFFLMKIVHAIFATIFAMIIGLLFI